jgi:hypothetical protein
MVLLGKLCLACGDDNNGKREVASLIRIGKKFLFVFLSLLCGPTDMCNIF